MATVRQGVMKNEILKADYKGEIVKHKDATKSISGIYFRSLEIYCVAAVLYLILTWLSSRLLQYLGKKLDTPVKSLPSSN